MGPMGGVLFFGGHFQKFPVEKGNGDTLDSGLIIAKSWWAMIRNKCSKHIRLRTWVAN